MIQAFGEKPAQLIKSGYMQTIKKDERLKRIARKSKLIRVIKRLYTLSSHEEIKDCQKRLDHINMRHSVLCRSGRLELIADLITEKKGLLKRPERKALDLISKDLKKEKRSKPSILDFSIDYLLSIIEENIIPPPLFAPDLINKAHAGKAVAALSLTGLVMSGCTQKETATQTDNLVQKLETAQPQKNKLALLSDVLETTQNENKPVSKFFTYSVKPGDNLRSIASKVGADYKELAQFNNIKYDERRNWFILHPGQKLILSQNIVAEKTAENKTGDTKVNYLSLKKTDKATSELIHFVVKGDSLWEISRQYKVPMEKIARINNIRDPRKIRYGNILKIPGITASKEDLASFSKMSREEKVNFLKKRTIAEGRQYIDSIVEISEEYEIDPRLYASLIWEESWFDSNAKSKDNCRKLAQLDPRFHEVSQDTKNNFRKSLGYLRHEFVYYRKKGFDKKSSAICALAAYNGGDTRIRRLIRTGEWDGKNISTIPIPETREHLKKIFRRCENNYQAVL